MTPKQKRLTSDIAELSKLFRLDVSEAVSAKSGVWRTTYLETIKRYMIRGQIVHWYTFADEMLACRIAWYFFGKSKTFGELWRTKRFQRFNHYILDQLALLPKLRLADEIEEIPGPLRNDIERLNTLRNGMAHSFFPENRRAAKLTWKGQDIFSVPGAETMAADMSAIFKHLDAYAPRWGRIWKSAAKPT